MLDIDGLYEHIVSTTINSYINIYYYVDKETSICNHNDFIMSLRGIIYSVEEGRNKRFEKIKDFITYLNGILSNAIMLISKNTKAESN